MPSPKLFAYALTTLDIIKARMDIKVNDLDDLIINTINRASDWIQNQTNRRFLQQVYTDEVYSVYGPNQVYLLLKQAPVTPGKYPGVAKGLQLFYRAGLPSTPMWTAFIPDQYELLEDGKSGLVRVYGPLMIARYINNAIKATYEAGYLIDWNHYDDPTKHNLPTDLSELCENLVVRRLKRRDSGDKSSQAFDGSTVSWKDALTSDDQATLEAYNRLPRFF